jgi:hypothetical protein
VVKINRAKTREACSNLWETENALYNRAKTRGNAATYDEATLSASLWPFKSSYNLLILEFGMLRTLQRQFQTVDVKNIILPGQKRPVSVYFCRVSIILQLVTSIKNT